ncbi:ExeM/NucH family extracellular endonuclease [Gynuella sp.]|uniref:ExeM/NucH family extracellular endonuclease n=1 Tax=Gynuella sp. TaxID=2969146 RepID=UPI003D0DBF7F
MKKQLLATTIAVLAGGTQADLMIDGQAANAGTCGTGDITLISAIQGSGGSSALEGQQVTVEAVVYQNQQATAQGYFIQEEEADSDGNEATSEGIFVFDTSLPVTVGDKVRLSAKVTEYKGLTELSSVSGLTVCSQNNTLPAATAITLPVTSLEAFEQVEGMRVSLANSNLVVSDFHGNGYGFGNYGQFVVSNELHYQPTEVSAPSKESYDAAIENIRLSSLLIDDGQSSQHPDPIVFPNSEGFSNSNYIRVGYGVSGITGAMHGYDSGSTTYPYQIIPSITPTFDPLNADRTLAPIVDSSANLKIASMNVLNLYNGIIVDDKPYFPTTAEEKNKTYGDYRGANSEADYNIQVAKIVAALDAMDADVIGLMEIENDGYDETSSIAALTNALNAVQTTDGEYAFVNPGGKMGTDSISVGLLYRPAVVTPVGTTTVLDSTNSPKDGEGNPLFIDDKNRPSLIQSFTHKATGDQFTVVVNHLKSKGSSCSSLGDPYLTDGQGNCNQTRTNAAKALVTFMAGHPTSINTDNVVFIGDMNAYAKEDPIAALEAGGYINLKYTSASTEAQPFSYSYSGFLGSLDHMIGSSGMKDRLVSVDDWHINSLESNLLDYDTTLDKYNSNDHFASLDPYYSSDHDPVIAGFVMKSATEDGDEDDDSSSGSTGLLLLPVLFMLMVARRKY